MNCLTCQEVGLEVNADEIIYNQPTYCEFAFKHIAGT